MEGMLHPVGPEEAQTYWIRRAGAVLVLVFLLMGVGSMIANIGGDSTPVAAEPAPADDAEPTAPAADPSDEVVDAEAVPVPSGAEPPKTEQKAPAETPAPAEKQATEPSPGPAGPSQSASPAAASAKPLPPEPANTFHRAEQATRSGPDRSPAAAAPCDPQAVRMSIDGPRQVQKGVPVMVRLGATNTSDRDCLIEINDKTFELKIFSGVDRIWSSLDCVTGLPPRGAVLAPGRSLDWEMEWRADRSASHCATNPETMGSGTYVATAQFTGAKPGQLVMQLKA